MANKRDLRKHFEAILGPGDTEESASMCSRPRDQREKVMTAKTF
jgi:hypothetical protein